MKKTVVAFALLALASSAFADNLQDRIAKIASSIDATVGVSAMDLSNGKKVSLRGDERFPMGSVYKYVIAEAVLKKASKPELSPDDEVTITPAEFAPGHSPLAASAHGKAVTLAIGDLLGFSLRDSDNTASDALLKAAGGPTAVMNFLRMLGVNGIDVSRSEKQIAADLKKKGVAEYLKDERDTSTPDAMRLLFRMSAEHADGVAQIFTKLENGLMAQSKWGLHRIAAGVPQGATVAGKTGTMPGGVVNEAALVTSPDGRHSIVMVIFTKGGKATEKQREEVMAKIAAEIYGDFATHAF